MEDTKQDRRVGRRAVIGSALVGAVAGVAGCTATDPPAAEEREDDRIAELEAELGRLNDRVEDLEQDRSELEAELERARDRLRSGNLWGFDRATIDRLQEVADTWTDSVVAIDAFTEDGHWGVGTGWVYDDGVIVSNAHVLAPKRLPPDRSITKLEVWDRTGHQAAGQLLGYTYGEDELFDRRDDIGFLSVPRTVTDGRVMDRGSSRALEVDEPLIQIGHPYSLAFWTAAAGPFLAHREPFFATNVPGRPGVSGSPVLDLDGTVVGMTWGGRYVRRPNREIGAAPEPGPTEIFTAFEEAVEGMHSYMQRIQTASEELL